MPRLFALSLLALTAALPLLAQDDPYSEAARTSFKKQFPDGEVLKVKEESHDSANFLSLWTMDASKPWRTYKVEGRDPHNKSIEAEYDRSGKLVKMDAAKVPLECVPEAARKAADDAHINVKWAPVAEFQKYQNSALYYTLKGRRGDKKISVRVTETGQVFSKSK